MWITDIPRMAFFHLGKMLQKIGEREWYRTLYEKIKKLR
jgi:hypothetical protein